MIRKLTSGLVDAATCLLVNTAQWASRNDVCTPSQLEKYLAQGERTTREDFFAVTPMAEVEHKGSFLRWKSPIRSGYKENDIASARLFLSRQGWSAPTLVFLHAFMSAHDFGYCRIARRLNRRGWNAVLVHLPFHYSRVPISLKRDDDVRFDRFDVEFAIRAKASHVAIYIPRIQLHLGFHLAVNGNLGWGVAFTHNHPFGDGHKIPFIASI